MPAETRTKASKIASRRTTCTPARPRSTRRATLPGIAAPVGRPHTPTMRCRTGRLRHEELASLTASTASISGKAPPCPAGSAGPLLPAGGGGRVGLGYYHHPNEGNTIVLVKEPGRPGRRRVNLVAARVGFLIRDHLRPEQPGSVRGGLAEGRVRRGHIEHPRHPTLRAAIQRPRRLLHMQQPPAPVIGGLCAHHAVHRTPGQVTLCPRRRIVATGRLSGSCSSRSRRPR